MAYGLWIMDKLSLLFHRARKRRSTRQRALEVIINFEDVCTGVIGRCGMDEVGKVVGGI